MTEIFWLKDPMILLNKNYITNVIPSQDLSYDAKLNAITRLIIIICVLGYLLTRNIRIIISAIISIIGIIIMYNINKGKQNQKKIIGKALKEGFNSDILYNLSKSSMTTPTKENPLMNVMLPEIQDNPKRNMAAPSFAPKVEKEINESVKKNLDPKLFQDLGDNIEFDSSMRSFYATANTQVPNDQKAFAEFCYGGMKSCKEGDGLACHAKNYKHTTPN